MYEVDALEVGHWISRYLFPFARIAGLLMVMPLLGTRLVPTRIRLILAIMMTLAVVPILPPFPVVDPLSVAAMVIVLQQILIGVALGFVVELLNQVFVLAGQLIAMQTGLGIATTVDPSQGASVVVISQWLLFLVSLVFLSLNGHLVLIGIMIDSFFRLPVGFEGLGPDAFASIVQWGSWMFAAALVISLPALTALLVVNLAFGVMTRAAPQLNIFSLGFPVTMIVGLFILWLTLSEMASGFQGLMEEVFTFTRKLTG
ncbi:flagellar biosynthetic protein FliR [Parathalassolituus penaei]|uniref:Flagellar biosynthetic protein FliR n=1 Tax=Parathalassolituus penaei TaxID=2997323 RepID=A0A9X3EF19_9GAMM|nr:flagellar biosynthetic protein FliR [Parathalassolituus penaei]MCY0966030.1 flagellar biosynthetic protein FliR [Parathalassolituus penaei]